MDLLSQPETEPLWIPHLQLSLYEANTFPILENIHQQYEYLAQNVSVSNVDHESNMQGQNDVTFPSSCLPMLYDHAQLSDIQYGPDSTKLWHSL
jgi:hypothetical protein